MASTSFNTINRYKKASANQLVHRYQIENLLKKYSRVKIPKELAENDTKTRLESNHGNKLGNKNVIQVTAKMENRQNCDISETQIKHRTKSSDQTTKIVEAPGNVCTVNQDYGLDYGLAMAAADYVAKVLAREEPEAKEERGLIIRQAFLQNMAKDFKFKPKDENNPCPGKVRVIIRSRKQPQQDSGKAVRAAASKTEMAQNKISTTQNTVVTKTRTKVQTVMVKKELIQTPIIKTTRIVRVMKA